MPNKSITRLPQWQALEAHFADLQDVDISDLFGSDENRFENFHETLDGLIFDYSKHHASKDTIALLMELAEACELSDWREKMVSGVKINHTEGRAVLHMALRGSVASSLMVDGENVSKFVQETLKQIHKISDDIRGNSAITDVVNIGVGGSDLGPRMVCDALYHDADGPNVHFVSNVDGHEITQLLAKLDPLHTVFIVASKSFSTLETMINAKTARAWCVRTLGEIGVADHFYAISTNVEAAAEFGIHEGNILPMRDWVGGRYSVWSAIGLPIAVAVGFDKFTAFLKGAKTVDQHFMDAPLAQNIPVLMAMLGIWYNNFHGLHTHCILPYAHSFQHLCGYIQQLDMESNGKSVRRDGALVDYATGPTIFGKPGTNGQHAFFQLLHQGTQIIPADFIAAINPNHNLYDHHDALLANALAQSEAFMLGQDNEDDPHRHFEGNRPNSMILMERFDPYHLGMLMALYEHKTFVQGVVWGINSFDQCGVELGKKLAKPITQAIESGQIPKGLDGSSESLIDLILEKFIKS